jgi:hypothetical protein
MQLPLTSALLTDELKGAKVIIERWLHDFETNGVPGEDQPLDEEQMEIFLRRFCGELVLCSHKCASLAEVLSEVR